VPELCKKRNLSKPWMIGTSLILFLATLFFCIRVGGAAPARPEDDETVIPDPKTNASESGRLVLSKDAILFRLGRYQYLFENRNSVSLDRLKTVIEEIGIPMQVADGIDSAEEVEIKLEPGQKSQMLNTLLKTVTKNLKIKWKTHDGKIVVEKAPPPSIFRNVGFLNVTFGNLIMLIIGMIFIHLAIKKDMEPYELLPIGFGIILGNLPLARLMSFSGAEIQQSGILGVFFHYGLYFHNILPPLIFLGLGAMTDFGPLIANPKMLIFGAAAQLGIFIAFWGALILGFNIHEAAAIGIIGGADGPTTIYTSAKVAPEILGITAVCAYTYMALVAIIQPPIMRLLTTKKERMIRMKMLRPVSKTEKILFPIVGTFVILLIVPLAAPLLGLFMLGNLFRESGVVPRLSDGAQNELMNIVTIFLMLCIGAWMGAENILKVRTLAVLALGITAFAFGTAGGLLLAKFMNIFLKEKINPLVGSAGVSAVPMAARISQIVGQREDPQNFLLMHAMGANVAGVIGSAVAAGLFLSLLT